MATNIDAPAGELPPLPEPCPQVLPTGWVRFTADQMRAYVLADRAAFYAAARRTLDNSLMSVHLEHIRHCDASDLASAKETFIGYLEGGLAAAPAGHAEPVAWPTQYANDWWVKELEAIYADDKAADDQRRAAHIALKIVRDGMTYDRAAEKWSAAPVAAEPAPAVPAQAATDLRAAVKAAINALADEVNNCDEDAANEKFTAGRCAGIFDLKRALLAQIGGGHE